MIMLDIIGMADRGSLPEWVPYYEECDIELVGVLEDIIARRLDHFTIRNDDFAAIECFLLP